MTLETNKTQNLNSPTTITKTSSLKIIEGNLHSKEEREHLESELRLTLEEIARLQNALAEVNMKLITYQNQQILAFPPDKEEISAFSDLLKEIYQPLTTITNYCDLLQNQSVGTLGSLQSKFLNRISSSVSQIHQLLDLFNKNIENQTSQIIEDSNLVSLADVISQVIKEKSDILQEKQITLQMIIPENLYNVTGDEEEIRTIIDTVLSNALTITPNDHVAKLIASNQTNETGNTVKLTIKDSGQGIPLDILEKLFSVHELMSQPDILGMALTRSQLIFLNDLVQDQGGILSIKNGIDSGVIFEIIFTGSKN